LPKLQPTSRKRVRKRSDVRFTMVEISVSLWMLLPNQSEYEKNITNSCLYYN
jgi:hypothetical protein